MLNPGWQIQKHGDNSVLTLKDHPLNPPNDGEIRVKMAAVGLNHLDLWVRKGVDGHQFPLPITLGCDAVGSVEPDQDLSKSNFKAGDRVLVNPLISCGECEACQNEKDPLCRGFGIFGETTNGHLQNFKNIPEKNLHLIPKEISDSIAAALPIASVTAWQMIHRKAKLEKDQSVLIHAGGSGVGSFAIQMAKNCGVLVATTVGDSKKAKLAKDLGADLVINYREESFRKMMKENSDFKSGVHAVIDSVGVETFSDSLKCLKRGGRYVFCGATSGSKVEIDLKAIFFKNLEILGSTMGAREDLAKVLAEVASGKIKPIIDREFDFQELPDAFSHMESRSNFGKVIIKF